MRATDERRSINAKCHSLLHLPDGSQGKQLKPQHHEASPLSQVCLRHVWKKALDSGTASSSGRSHRHLAKTGFWVTPVLSACTVPLRRSEAAFSSHRVEATAPGEQTEAPSGLCSVLLAGRRCPRTSSHTHIHCRHLPRKVSSAPVPLRPRTHTEGEMGMQHDPVRSVPGKTRKMLH